MAIAQAVGADRGNQASRLRELLKWAALGPKRPKNCVSSTPPQITTDGSVVALIRQRRQIVGSYCTAFPFKLSTPRSYLKTSLVLIALFCTASLSNGPANPGIDTVMKLAKSVCG